MPQTIKRKCGHCKQYFLIDKDDLNNAVLYKNHYYHRDCYVALCEGRVALNNGYSPFWQNNLDNIEVFVEDAKEKSRYQFAKDDLNEHLLSHYNIKKIPSRFWNVLADLGNGVYNNMKCNPVSTDLISGCWIWGQSHLNAVKRKNEIRGTGPKNDDERINYDLAIVLGHIEDYKKYLAKLKAEEAERKQAAATKIKVNYNNIAQGAKQNDGLDDISGLLDDIF